MSESEYLTLKGMQYLLFSQDREWKRMRGIKVKDSILRLSKEQVEDAANKDGAELREWRDLPFSSQWLMLQIRVRRDSGLDSTSNMEALFSSENTTAISKNWDAWIDREQYDLENIMRMEMRYHVGKMQERGESDPIELTKENVKEFLSEVYHLSASEEGVHLVDVHILPNSKMAFFFVTTPQKRMDGLSWWDFSSLTRVSYSTMSLSASKWIYGLRKCSNLLASTRTTSTRLLSSIITTVLSATK